VAAVGQDRFGVELDAHHREVLVAQAHDDPVLGFGGDLQAVGDGRPVDDQRVVAGRLEGVGEVGEEAVTGVGDHRRLAVHHLAGPHDLSAVELADALVAQADAEHRDAPATELVDGGVGDAGVLGAARPR
jgi:hypothetical protein